MREAASVLEPKGLMVAEAFELLRLSMPPAARSVGWWADMDYALAGAHLIDLSLQGLVDTDITTIKRTGAGSWKDAHSVALDALDRLGGTAPLDVVLEDVVSRIGDLRSAILSALQIRTSLRVMEEKIVWGFAQQAVDVARAGGVETLNAALIALVEGDELPLPEDAALVSVLHASGVIAHVLGIASPRTWLERHEKRIHALHRMDLIGQSVSAAITAMRQRLHAYVLGSGATPKGREVRRGTLWEWRAFWPAGRRVVLPAALDLMGQGDAGLEEKNMDVYLFLHGKRDNIKLRGKGLKLKPVIEAFDAYCAFGPSAKIDLPARAEAFADVFPRFNEVQVKLRTREDLMAALSANGYRPGVIEVRKTRRKYRAIWGVKIELALIEVNGRTFHSLSLESRFLTALRVLSRNVGTANAIVGSYGEFLERVSAGGA